MLNFEKRRKIAREFLEKNFGQYGGALAETIDGKPVIIKAPFELWKHYDEKFKETQAIRVIHAPYASGSKMPVIVVGETYEEVAEIGKKVVDEERWATGSPEFEQYKKYWVMYD